MSYQPPPGGQQPAQNGNGQPQQPTGPITQGQMEREQAEQVLEQILGGELPGAGYLFPKTPAERASVLTPTNPEQVRDWLLRATETMAIAASLPYGMDRKGELGKAILECAQAYLLLDPSVDQQGVQIGAAAAAEADATKGVNDHKATLDHARIEHEGAMQAAVAAHASGQRFERPITVNGYQEPPKVLPNPAEQAIGEKHKAQSQELKGARGDRPRPQPRVGG